MSPRHRNDGLRKICDCSRRSWAKCEHPWHFSFKWDGRPYRFSLDREVGRRMKDKTDARGEADRLRIAIREGRFRQPVAIVPVPATPDAKTFADFADTYLTRGVQASGKKTWYDDKIVLGKLAAFTFGDGSTLGTKAIGAITEDDLEAVLASLRARGRSISTCNKYIQVTKAAFRWAARKGYLAASPISTDSALKRRKPTQRNRRLEPGEADALLKAAPLRLYRIIVAAIETGCRFGELISLQWRHVDLVRREITILAEHSKTATGRVLPVSDRLAGVLEMAKLDPAGQEHTAEKCVFGDEIGGPVKSYKKSWETAVLVAHGVEAAWTATNSLDPASRAAFRAIGLHFHDLRHEAGSRWLEAGWPLSHVRDMLGHTDIKTTSTYLNANRTLLQESMKKLDKARALQVIASEAAGEQRPPCNAPEAAVANSFVM